MNGIIRALLLINPNSRRGRDDIESVLDVFRQSGFEIVAPSTSSDTDIERLIVDQGKDADMVIVGGGDGTLNGAIEGVLRLGKPLGVLPLGTANDLARTLDLPTDLEECAHVITRGKTRKVDLGHVNGKHFFNVASLGVSSDVARELDQDLKSRFGVFGYALSLWRAVAKRRSIKARLRYEGRLVSRRVIQISVGNGRFYGGGMTIAADARIDAGTLDLVTVTPQSIWQLIYRLPIFRWGHHSLNDNVQHVKIKEIELSTKKSLPINTDGEVTARTPATFRSIPQAIEIFVP